MYSHDLRSTSRPQPADVNVCNYSWTTGLHTHRQLANNEESGTIIVYYLGITRFSHAQFRTVPQCMMSSVVLEIRPYSAGNNDNKQLYSPIIGSKLMTKTELLWCASSRQQHLTPNAPLRVYADDVAPTKSVRDLGIYIDSDMSMKTHVSRTVSSCFAALRHIRSIRRSVCQPVLLSLVRSWS